MLFDCTELGIYLLEFDIIFISDNMSKLIIYGGLIIFLWMVIFFITYFIFMLIDRE